MQKKKELNVEWSAQAWPVGIEIRKPRGVRRDDVDPFFAHPPFVSLCDSHLSFRTKRQGLPPRRGAFTLVEMLVVIAIIAILAGILLPALARGKIQAKVKTAVSEMQNISTAIAAYETDYSRPPASKLAEGSGTTAQDDFTFGDTGLLNPIPIANTTPPHTHNANNSELMVILMNENRGANQDHMRNPRKVSYFSPRQVSGPVHGLSADDFVLRDPFGNPYIITLDLNDDNKSRDAFYQKASVSERSGGDNVGFHGVSRAAAAAPFDVNGPIAIWTFGPDKSANGNVKANEGVNEDNILSWK